MAIRKIARMGHPCLRAPNREVTAKEILSADMKRLIEDMIETMQEYEGIGLAAPQVHENIQMAIVGFDSGNARYPGEDDQPLTVVFNPKIEVLDPALQGYWEGCLSIPEIRGLVFRPRKVRVSYLDVDAKPQAIEAEGFVSTVFQHELDHLAATLFVDRIQWEPGKSPISFVPEYERFHVPDLEGDIGEMED